MEQIGRLLTAKVFYNLRLPNASIPQFLNPF